MLLGAATKAPGALRPAGCCGGGAAGRGGSVALLWDLVRLGAVPPGMRWRGRLRYGCWFVGFCGAGEGVGGGNVEWM